MGLWISFKFDVSNQVVLVSYCSRATVEPAQHDSSTTFETGLSQFFTQIQSCIKQILEQMIYILYATISPNHQPIGSHIITAHDRNSFGLNLNYIGDLFRFNEFVSDQKMCFWNFDGKCLPFTLIAELFYNYWKALFVILQEQTNKNSWI